MRRHFETFDALRFFAFFKVFLLHLPITAFPIFSFLKAGGGIGVAFFFVLSGFLISYIIISEKAATGKLDLYHFFMRRILRIWPLYFLMVAFAYSTPYVLKLFNVNVSNEGYEPSLWWSLTFLENYKMILTHDHPNVSPLGVMWSLCIEEHFYILWGVMLFFIKIDKIPWLIFSAITLSLGCNFYFVENNIPTAEISTNLIFFAFGAIPAYLMVKREDIFNKKIFTNKEYVWPTFILIISYVVIAPNVLYPLKDYIEPFIFSSLFCLLLFITIPLKSVIKVSDTNLLSKAGIYTYGLYLYHTIVINVLKQLYSRFNISLDNAFNAWSFAIISLGFTILFSIASYHFFENYFLKLKRYFR